MKLIHLSDLHLGKRLREESLLEVQRDILEKIIAIIDDIKPDAVVIAGDIYDKTVPPAEAVQMFDNFLFNLSKQKLQVFIISGNHDSAERVAFGGRLMDRSGIHLSPVYNGNVQPISLEDEYGVVDVYLLPFLKPLHIRQIFPDEPAETYTDALRTAISHIPIDPTHRNVLAAHQFVTGAALSESEELTVGGLDNVDADVFESFDYVALGHIHKPQSIGRETIRYCGTPLKYSFSEKDQQKSVTCVELLKKGCVRINTIPLTPQYDLQELRGRFEELCGGKNENYLRIVLTDEEDVPNAMSRLRDFYPRLLQIGYDNTRTNSAWRIGSIEQQECKTPLELFEALFEQQNGHPMSDEQREFSEELFRKIQEGEQS